jgi:glutathione peroxidase
MFQKIDVKGKDQHPLYKYLTSAKKGFITNAIKWNFTKFLIDREGNVVERFASKVTPKELETPIEALL